MLGRTAPAVLELLEGRRAAQQAGDRCRPRGAPRQAGRHPHLMRLAVTGRVVEHGGKFTLPPIDGPAEG